MFNKTKEYNSLISLLQEKCDKLERELSRTKNIVPADLVVVRPPANDSEARDYLNKIASMTIDNGYLFFLSQLRRLVVDEFEANSNGATADFYRGKLSAISDIFAMSRKAAHDLEMMQLQNSGGDNAQV